MMSTVLVVQPDEVQADVLRQIFAKRVGAELVMVDSTMEAVDEIARRMPDLILLSALLSPKRPGQVDRASSIGRRRLASADDYDPSVPHGSGQAPEKKGGLFRKKSKAPAPVGCDPMAFAEEVVAHLKAACEIRNRPQTTKGRPDGPILTLPAPHPLIEDDANASASAFDTTPFQSPGRRAGAGPIPVGAASWQCRRCRRRSSLSRNRSRRPRRFLTRWQLQKM